MTSKDGLPTMTTFTGQVFDFRDPKPESICIEDIAHALALECRFQNQCRVLYNVAQHSLLVERYVERPDWLTPDARQKLSRLALMHDAAEAYMGDVCRPLKILLPDYKVIQDRVERAIAIRFGLDPREDLVALVKDIDQRILANEGAMYMQADWRDAIVGPNPAITISPWLNSDESEYQFLERYRELFGESTQV